MHNQKALAGILFVYTTYVFNTSCFMNSGFFGFISFSHHLSWLKGEIQGIREHQIHHFLKMQQDLKIDQLF